jgi:hypothetical protein
MDSRPHHLFDPAEQAVTCTECWSPVEGACDHESPEDGGTWHCTECGTYGGVTPECDCEGCAYARQEIRERADQAAIECLEQLAGGGLPAKASAERALELLKRAS